MSQDDFDARFRDLVDDEFGIRVAGPVIPEPAPPTTPYRPADAFSFDRALDAADPTPDPADRFVPPVPQRMRVSHNPIGWIAVVLLVCPVVVAVVRIFVHTLPGWVTLTAGICFGLGLALLLFVVLPRHRPAPLDDGVRL
ncbi:MAG: hypothetical protein FWF75_03215 [Propionibacteriaceae bacterium]|nr:hypothetical protein [Propionibacteriaceae bacterium]